MVHVILELLRLMFRSVLYVCPLYRVRKKRILRDILLILVFSLLIWFLKRTGIQVTALLEKAGYLSLCRYLPALWMGFITLSDWAMVMFLTERKKWLSLLSVFLSDIMIQTAFALSEGAESLFAQFFTIPEWMKGAGSFNYGFHIPFAASIFSLIAVLVLRRMLKQYEPREEDLKRLLVLSLLIVHYNHVIIRHFIFVSEDVFDNLTIMSGFVMLPAMILVLFFKTMQNTQLKSLEESARKTLELGRSQLAMWKQNEEKIMETKHRIAEHLNILSSFLADGQYEAAMLYLKKTGGITNVEFPLYAKNPYVNAVINYQKMNNPEFVFDVISNTSDEIPGINQVDLGILIMNLIDLRIAEIRRHHLKEEIRLRITQKDQLLCILIDSEISEDFGEDHERSAEIARSVIDRIIERAHGRIHDHLHTDSDQAVIFSLAQ